MFFSLSTINYKVGQKVTKFSIFSDPTRKLSAVPPELRIEYGNSKTTTLLPSAKIRDHSSKVELAATGVHSVGMISSHASV